MAVVAALIAIPVGAGVGTVLREQPKPLPSEAAALTRASAIDLLKA